MSYQDTKKLEAAYGTFFPAIEEYISAIDSSSFKGHGHTFKSLLYFGVLETLAKCVYPHEGNKKKITNFIQNFCDWKHREKISLPHLVRLLHIAPSPDFESLRKMALGLLDKWDVGSLIYLDNDPDISTLQKHMGKKSISEKLLEGKVNIEQLKHINLFYRFRNSLVHELRRLGYGFQIVDDDVPYYHSYEREDVITWELVYPTKFIKSLIETGLKNMTTYFIENRLNPFQSYDFGTYWVGELNE